MDGGGWLMGYNYVYGWLSAFLLLTELLVCLLVMILICSDIHDPFISVH